MDTCPAEKCKHFFGISLILVLMMRVPELPVRAYRWTNEIRVESKCVTEEHVSSQCTAAFNNSIKL